MIGRIPKLGRYDVRSRLERKKKRFFRAVRRTYTYKLELGTTVVDDEVERVEYREATWKKESQRDHKREERSQPADAAYCSGRNPKDRLPVGE